MRTGLCFEKCLSLAFILLCLGLMQRTCPHCKSPNINAHGRYQRLSDGVRVARTRCLSCRRTFSEASHDVCFAQKKRHLNHPLWMLLVSGISLRRVSKVLRISRTTSARKLLFLGRVAKCELKESLRHKAKLECVEFDDMETFEHSKCKPLSISLAVESGTRRILGFEVSQMPANGPLAKIAKKRYGRRPDQRLIGRKRLLRLCESSQNATSSSSPMRTHTILRSFASSFRAENIFAIKAVAAAWLAKVSLSAEALTRSSRSITPPLCFEPT